MEHAPLNGTSTARQETAQNPESSDKRRFILRAGVVRFGGWIFAITTAYDVFRNYRTYSAHDYVFAITSNLLIWVVVGYAYGSIVWKLYYAREDNGT